jgi:uncharacterized membrane protein YedE/YeeE
MGAPIAAPTFEDVSSQSIDRRLVGGAALFGLGWGLSGFCPGPAVATLGAGLGAALVFVPFMAAGMFLNRLIDGARAGDEASPGRGACQ